MKKTLILFFLSTLNVSYGESFWFSTDLVVSKCEASTKDKVICSTRQSDERNTSVALNNCFFQNDIETCNGSWRIEHDFDGVSFSAWVDVEKRTEGTNKSIYSMTVTMGVPLNSEAAPGHVIITLGEVGTLTDSLRLIGDRFWANDKKFYIPYFTIGPVKPNSNDDE